MEMESMLFSNVPAEKLNQQVREKIADHLFLICHYNPCSNVFAEDAKFIAGCLNLYKATVDSSCMIRRMEKTDWFSGAFCKDAGALRACMAKIQMLRAVWAHDQAKEMDDSAEQDYCQWVRNILKKDSPESQKDYSVLLHELELLGNRLYTVLESYIQHLATYKNRPQLIQAWEQETYNWYSKKTAIFRNQLFSYGAAIYPDDAKSIRYRVAERIQEYYTNEKKLAMFESLVSGGIGAGAAFVIKVDQMRKKRDAAYAKVRAGRWTSAVPFCFLDMFFDELPEILSIELPKIRQRDQCSLMPEELLQRQIKEMLDNKQKV